MNAAWQSEWTTVTGIVAFSDKNVWAVGYSGNGSFVIHS